MKNKLFGAAMIFAAFTFGGCSVSNSMRTRCLFWESFITALEILKAEISFSGTDLKKAFFNAARLSGQELFSEAAKNIETVGLDEAWKSAVDKFALKANDKGTLLLLSSKLGKTDASGQEKHINYILKLAEEIKAEAYKAYEHKGALFRRGGVLAGIFAVLILI